MKTIRDTATGGFTKVFNSFKALACSYYEAIVGYCVIINFNMHRMREL